MRAFIPLPGGLTAAGLALALGPLLAGCLGLLGGGDTPPATKAEAPQPQSSGTTPAPPQAPPGVATRDASSPKGFAEARMATPAPQAIRSGMTQLPPETPGVAPRAAGRNPTYANITGASGAAPIPVAPPSAAASPAPADAPASSVAASLALAPPSLPAATAQSQAANAQPAPRQQQAYQGVQPRSATRGGNKMSEGSPIPDREQAVSKPIDKSPVTSFYQPTPGELPKLPGAGGAQTASAPAKPAEPLPLPAGIDPAAQGVPILDVFRKDGKLAQFLTRVDDVYAERSAQLALEYTRDRAQRPWTNPDTGSSGTVGPTKTYVKDGAYCREYALTVEARQNGSADVKGAAQTAGQIACRQANGRWKFLP